MNPPSSWPVVELDESVVVLDAPVPVVVLLLDVPVPVVVVIDKVVVVLVVVEVLIHSAYSSVLFFILGVEVSVTSST